MKNVLVALIVAVALGAAVRCICKAGRCARRRRPAVTGVVNAPEPAPVDPAPYLAAFP